jgi:5-methylcytosine-specific restriction endonuclease McrA
MRCIMSGFSKLRKHLKRRASSKGIECSISADLLRALWYNTPHCPICFAKFSDEINDPRARSVDRFDASCGYTPENVDILCRQCNSLKSIFDRDGLGELNRLAPAYSKNFARWFSSKRGKYVVNVR